jgi:hypothetical protein
MDMKYKTQTMRKKEKVNETRLDGDASANRPS